MYPWFGAEQVASTDVVVKLGLLGGQSEGSLRNGRIAYRCARVGTNHDAVELIRPCASAEQCFSRVIDLRNAVFLAAPSAQA